MEISKKPKIKIKFQTIEELKSAIADLDFLLQASNMGSIPVSIIFDDEINPFFDIVELIGDDLNGRPSGRLIMGNREDALEKIIKGFKEND